MDIRVYPYEVPNKLIEQTAKVNISLQNTPTGKALKLIQEGKIRKAETGYLVVGSRGLTWEITEGKCQCEGFTFRGYCYHSKAAQMIESGILEGEIVI